MALKDDQIKTRVLAKGNVPQIFIEARGHPDPEGRNRHRAWTLIDTGASRSVIPHWLAKEFPAEKKLIVAVELADGSMLDVDLIDEDVPDFLIGGWTIQPPNVWDIWAHQLTMTDEEIDQKEKFIIGRDVLAQFRIELALRDGMDHDGIEVKEGIQLKKLKDK